jgi:hypothetical protein
VINPVSENAFPTWRFAGQKLWGEQGVENCKGVRSIIVGLCGFSNSLGKLKHSCRGDGSSGTFVGRSWIWFFPIVRGNSMRWSALDIKIGTTLGRIEEPGVLGKLVSRRETIDGPGVRAPNSNRCAIPGG